MTLDAPIAAFWKAHAAYKASVAAFLTLQANGVPKAVLRDALAGSKRLYSEMLAAQEAVVAAASDAPTLTKALVADASGSREWRS